MTRLAVVLSALAAAALPASIAAADSRTDLPSDTAEPGPGEPGSMIPSGIDRGYVQPPLGTPVPPQVAQQDISKIIFVNRCVGGCTFTKSPNGVSDAITNKTWLGDAPLGSTITISEFSHSEQVWQDTLACIRDVYSPYGVMVTDVDPGNVPHHEAVLAGRDDELPIDALGVAPLGGGACQPANNVISFSFANQHGPLPDMTLAEHMCWTVAQESAHSYSLDHEFDCSDPLTYLNGCGPKFFRNKDVVCGRFQQEPCICGGATQNSHELLTAVLGVGTAPPAPMVAISMPLDGATVQAGFSVFTTVIDRRGVKNIDLLINGWKWSETEGVFGKTSPYVLDIPNGVPDGVMDIDVRGCNDIDSCATARVTVTRGAACGDASSCLTGQRCDAGRCMWDPPAGQMGDACTYNEFCTTGLCADTGAGLACTETCFGGPNDLCPGDFVCNSAPGAPGVCAAPPEDEGGCCSAGGGGTPTGALALNVALGTLVGLVVIRRRRRRA
jgi:hypothetical protein